MDRFKLELPKELTKEEKELAAKYSLLKSLKQKLKLADKNQNVVEFNRRIADSQRQGESSQIYLKEAACKILKAKEEKRNTQSIKTSGFKRSIKQNEFHQIVKKCIMSEYTPEVDLLPRSVTIHGRNLNTENIRKSFQVYGEIARIKIADDSESAVVVYRKPESAKKAVDSRHQEREKISVELVKKRNNSWVDLAVKEATTQDAATNREKNTVHVSYEGPLTVQDFRRVFRHVGRIEKIYVYPHDSSCTSNPKKQFAFVTFQYETEAERAVEEVNGQMCNGITLIVSFQRKIVKDSSVEPSYEKDTNNTDSRELVVYDECHQEREKFIVELMKKRNNSGVDLAVKEATTHDAATNREKNTVHVSYEGPLTEQDFRRVFRPVGRIEKIHVSPHDSSCTSNPKKQFAFVTFQYETEAERAVEKVNGQMCNGITLTVSPEKKMVTDSSVGPSYEKDSSVEPSFKKDTNNIVSRELVVHDELDG